MNSISRTVARLLDEQGLSLLEDPLRLEAYLRDLHPEEPQSVFLLIEVMQTGILGQLCRKRLQLDSEIEGLAAKLTALSGIVPRLSFWAIQSWSMLLPDEVYRVSESPEKANPAEEWKGTIGEILFS